MPEDEEAGEESQHVEGKIDHHKRAATPLGGGGRIRIHGGMNREKTQSVQSGNQAQQDESDWAGVQAGEDEGGSGDVVRDAEKTEKAKEIGGGGTREIETSDVGGGVGKNDCVHETAQQIDTSKEDGHDGDKFWDGSMHGVCVRRLELADTEGLADDGLEGGGFIEEGDFDAKKENGNIAGGKGGKSDGIFFGGDEGKAASGSGAGEGVFHFGGGEAVVIGKGALVDDFGAEFDQPVEEAFGHGDAGDGADAEAAQVGERETFPREKIFEVKGVMATGVDGGVAVMAADLFFEFGVIFARAFGQENEIGPAEGIGGFAQDSAGENVLIAEGVLAVDEEEIEAVAEAEVLKAVVEEEGIGLVVADGVAGGFDAIGIDEDGDAGEIAGEHEGFVARLGGIEQDRFSVGDNAGRGRGTAREKFIGQAGEEGFGYGFVTATEDGDATAGGEEGAGEFFHDGGFAGATDSEVAHADDHDADGVAAEDRILVEAGAKAHDAGVDGGKEEKEGFEEGGSATGGTIEDDIGGKLFEGFEGFEGHDSRLGGVT